MPRPWADRGTLDLVSVLAEHCTHPQAHVIASELEFRIVLIAAFAAGSPDVEPMRKHLPNLTHGIALPDGPQRPAPRGVPDRFVCDIDESAGLAEDSAA